MTLDTLANLTAFPVCIICSIIAIRAFYIYSLSRSNMLFILGLSMAYIALATLVGTVGPAHLWGVTWNTEWQRAFGACAGGFFIFLSSVVTSQGQMERVKRWQIIILAVYLVVAVMTPLYPPFASPWIVFILYWCRIVIYLSVCVRYTYLYVSKSSRFSLLMAIALIILITGYVLNLPGLVLPGLPLLTITAAFVRIVGYLGLLYAYSVG